ncbi:MAG: enoyl-CoA hydratase/isomerase family protein, partial [Pseudomonadota bacterium]
MSEQAANEDGSVTLEARGRTLLIGLNRPKKLNGLTPTMMRQLAGAYTRLNAEEDLWVGVVFAHGDHFCAGLDLPKFADKLAQGEFTAVTDENPDDVDPFALKKKCKKPVICAVGGITYTAGL